MTNIDIHAELKPLREDVLKLIVADAELRINAQLGVAVAADQRALTFAGFSITASSAAIGGVLILYNSRSDQLWIYVVAAIISLGMMAASILAVWSVRSKEYFLPGSRPGIWVPNNWSTGVAGPHTVRQAYLDQAYCLEIAILDNVKNAVSMGKIINVAMYFALGSVILSGLIATGSIIG